MEKFHKSQKSRNDKSNTIFKNISSYISEGNLDNNNYNLNYNSFNNSNNNNLKIQETSTDYRNYFNKSDKTIIDISADKIIEDSNDINFTNENIKNNSNDYYQSNMFIKSNNILDNYIIRLKNFGYPEIGEIYLSSDTHEQEKTFNFFDYIIAKEANNIEKNNIKEKEFEDYKKKCKDLEYKIISLNQEYNNNIKNSINLKKDLEHKLKKQKEFYEQNLSTLNKDNEYLTYVNNKIYFKKKNLELKLYSMNKTINKFENMKSNIINAVEAIDYVQNTDMAKMLSRVKGAEKLIEALKGGYNESLRQLSLELSSYKNLIFEIHNEICVLLDNPYNIENKVYDMTYLDAIEYYKRIFKNNINLIKERFETNGIMSRRETIC